MHVAILSAVFSNEKSRHIYGVEEVRIRFFKHYLRMKANNHFMCLCLRLRLLRNETMAYSVSLTLEQYQPLRHWILG